MGAKNAPKGRWRPSTAEITGLAVPNQSWPESRRGGRSQLPPCYCRKGLSRPAKPLTERPWRNSLTLSDRERTIQPLRANESRFVRFTFTEPSLGGHMVIAPPVRKGVD